MNQTLLTAGALILGSVIGFFIGISFGNESVQTGVVAEGQASLEARLESAKQYFPEESDVRSFSGTVQGIGENSISVEISSWLNPLEDLPRMREIIVTPRTDVVRLIEKDPSLFEQELRVYQQQLEDGATADILPDPEPVTETLSSFEDIEVGDTVTFEAEQNIKTEIRFEVVRIKVQTQEVGTGGGAPPPPPDN